MIFSTRNKLARTKICMKCAICNKILWGTFLVDSWGQKICSKHKVEYCTSCGRFVKPTDIHLSDGRCLCSFCKSSIVVTPQHVSWVNQKVRDILLKIGFGALPMNIPIQIVTPQEMAKLNGTGVVNFNQAGLTKYRKISSASSSKKEYRIYVLDYFQKVKFAGVLAHELIHVWQYEKDIALSTQLTEGLCNLASYLVYKDINTDLSRMYIKFLQEDHDPIYGDGFRKVLALYQQHDSANELVMYVLKNNYD